jgi:hypothetical protein
MVTLPDGVPSRCQMEGQRFRQLRAILIVVDFSLRRRYPAAAQNRRLCEEFSGKKHPDFPLRLRILGEEN